MTTQHHSNGFTPTRQQHAAAPSLVEREPDDQASPTREFDTQHRTALQPALSLIAPVFNEVDNLAALLARIDAALAATPDFELILVDDGSHDGSRALIAELCERDRRVIGVYFASNCGQTAAIAAGLEVAAASVLATLDADLQNDPSDLPRMLARLESEPVDAVVGYRMTRSDNFVRRASSRFANSLRNRLSGDSIRDTGCSLKVFRAEALRAIPLFEGMHRFLPTLLRYYGFSVVEEPVRHHPRVAGVSKYGIRNRALRAFRDLLAVRWMRARMIQPQIAGVQRGRQLERP